MGFRHGHPCALRLIKRQQRILFEAAPPSLRPLRQIQSRKQNGEHQADEDGDGKNFHEGGRSIGLTLAA